ncbi:hypothetical protein [Sphingomonas sp. 35-24ZXX]|uniref:hypothetical protein n=1 Tax=Sphingomonas sp. 35-24ZXX TaxID=1545915 RepID=UPI000A4CA1CB|nr:hypothetical protein [Sphingomonas sp. 35-24ZXX]
MTEHQSLAATPAKPDTDDALARKQRIRAVFARYPNISNDERQQLTDFLKSGPLLDIGLLKGDEAIRYKIAAFEQEQEKALANAPMQMVVLLVIFVLLAVVCSALWDMGT